MAKINPYLLVKNGKESIELYKELFGAKELRRLPFTKEMGYIRPTISNSWKKTRVLLIKGIDCQFIYSRLI